MDLSQFLDVSCDVGEEPINNLTEDDIVLVDDPSSPVKGGKRSNSGGAKTPPAKKSKPTPKSVKRPAQQLKQLGMKKANLSQQAMGILTNSNLTVKKVVSPSGGNPRPVAKPPMNPITWKYRQLTENLYNGDIKKADLLKDYEPEKCVCKEPDEGELACGEGCINRSTFTECDKELCEFGERCGNQKLQRRQYAPGLERFMTQKKGWGVRARQAISAGTLILEYMGEMCSAPEFEKRMVTRYKGDTHHYCLALDSKTVIDAQRAGSECRFVNHSCDPNSEMQKWNVSGLYRMAVFAKRDILPGEEITYDYNFSLFDSNQGQECKCGAAECRGVIGGKGKNFLITVNDDDEASSPVKKVSVAAADPSGQVTADEKWFKGKLSAEDMSWMLKNAPKVHQLEAKTIKCTVCNDCLNFKVAGQIQRHPELGVILCNKCRRNYGKGGWERDTEGNDEFCRWCSEGGQIYLCDYCPKAFCNKCLRWNLGRKYVKDIEEQEKWKCLLCDPTTIRGARADYWAIHQYHKDKSAKAAKSVRTIKNGSAKASPVMVRKPAAGDRPVPGIRPILKNGSSPYKGGMMARQHGMPVPRMVPTIRPPVMNGGAAYKKHFVDSMLLEAERSVNKLRSMVNDIRKSWYSNHGKRDDKTIILATKKIREAFAASKVNLDNSDRKVLEIFRTNLEDADIRDIEPDLTDDRKQAEEKIFAKSSVVEEIQIENVESVPDLPFPVEDDGAAEVVAENGTENTEEKDGILDMSIEELEEGNAGKNGCEESVTLNKDEAQENGKDEESVKVNGENGTHNENEIEDEEAGVTDKEIEDEEAGVTDKENEGEEAGVTDKEKEGEDAVVTDKENNQEEEEEDSTGIVSEDNKVNDKETEDDVEESKNLGDNAEKDVDPLETKTDSNIKTVNGNETVIDSESLCKEENGISENNTEDDHEQIKSIANEISTEEKEEIVKNNTNLDENKDNSPEKPLNGANDTEHSDEKQVSDDSKTNESDTNFGNDTDLKSKPSSTEEES